MELKFCELPQGARFVNIDISKGGMGLYIPRDSLNAPAAVTLSLLAGNGYIGRCELMNKDAGEHGHVIWFTDKGRRFMDGCRRFADLLHLIGADKTGKEAIPKLDKKEETKEELPELNRTELSRLDYYNIMENSIEVNNVYRMNNIYVNMRHGKADLQSYPVLARLEALGLIVVTLLEDANDPQPEKLFRISVTDRGREVLRRAREKNRV